MSHSYSAKVFRIVCYFTFPIINNQLKLFEWSSCKLTRTAEWTSIKYKKKALYLSVKVFSMKVLIGETIFMSSTGDGIAILRGQWNHAKV